MNPRQVTLLYGIGGVVLLGALSALFRVEQLQLRKIEQDTVEARADAERLGLEIAARPAQAARAAALETALAAHRRLLPREVDAEAVYDRLLQLRRKHGLAELVITAARDEQLGLWPTGSSAAFVPPAHPALRPWTRYVGVAGRYGQILAFLNEVERLDTIQLVRDLVVVRGADPSPGAIPLRAGFSLTLYAGAPAAAPGAPLSDPELRALLGTPHALARGVTDDWAAKGIDWRTTPAAALPARNPFDPYPALTKASPAAPVLDLDALALRLTELVVAAEQSGTGFDAGAAAIARDLGEVAPEGVGPAGRWRLLRGRLAELGSIVGGMRAPLAAHEAERAAIAALAPAQREAALARTDALAQAIRVEPRAALKAEWAALDARVAALKSSLEPAGQPDAATLEGARGRLKDMNVAGAAGDFASLPAQAQSLTELAARYPGSTELAGLARDAVDLAGRAKRFAAIAGGLKFTGTVVANGVKHALVGGRRYRPGDRIEVEGESLEVLELDDARLVLGWKGLRAIRAR